MDTPPSAAPKSQFYARVIGLATAVLLGWVCALILMPFASVLCWAMFGALLLHPVHVKLQQKLGKRQQHATWLLTLAASLALIGPLAALGSMFIAQATHLLQQLQASLGRDDIQQLLSHPQLEQSLRWLQRTFSISTSQLRAWTGEATHALLQLLASNSGYVVLGTLSAVVDLMVTLFLMYFFLRDGENMLGTVRKLLPMRPAARDQLFNHLSAVTRAVMYGTGLTALVQGILVSMAFVFTGLPSPVVFGVLAMLLGLLPVGGTALVWIPAALVLFAQQRWGAGIFMLVWGTLLVSLADNFLKPMLISGRAEVATLTIFLGVLGGIAAFGAIGLFLGPVILALALAMIRFTIEQREAARTHPVS